MIKNKKNKLKVFSTTEEMNRSAAQLIIDLAGESVTERGRFVLCLSGGETPKSLYSLLSEKPYRELIPWQNTFVFWSDERMVPSEDERNNANMAISVLLSKIDIPAYQIYRIPVNIKPVEAARQYEADLKSFFGEEPPRFDLILLGLGENGHTASLFPGTEVLHEKSHWVKEVYVDEMRMYRVTMTAPLINQARKILFLVSGKEKAPILKEIITMKEDAVKFPVQLINPDPGVVDWYVDEQAASGIPVSLRNDS